MHFPLYFLLFFLVLLDQSHLHSFYLVDLFTKDNNMTEPLPSTPQNIFDLHLVDLMVPV